MGNFVAVTDEDLARARKDRAFKHALLASSLEQLLSAMNKLKGEHADIDPALARQIREGVAVAVDLADRIRKIAG